MAEETFVHPKSRSLEEVIAGCEIAQSELNFQLMRLEQHVRPKTPAEQEYHDNLKNGYNTAQYWLGVLIRYHKGRLERRGEPVDSIVEGTATGPFIDEEPNA